jgi:transcription initiation factor TFIIF subunit alpha
MSRPLKRIPIPEPKRRRPPPPKQAPVKFEAETTPAAADTPSGSYVDYKLTSLKHSDKKWDVFKLQSHHDAPIDLNTWPAPVKLNRKDFKSRNEVEEQAGPLTPMLGQDGKPVIGPDGKIVMLNADGTRVKKEEEIKAAKKKGKEDPNAKKKAFMKKTRQVHMIPDEVRAFRKEHRKDWLLEDNGGGLAASQSWSGKYSDVNDKHIWAFFAPVPDNDKEFRFIPVHRFYNFTRNSNVNAERVESQVSSYAFHPVACLQMYVQHARMQAAKSNTKAKPKKEEEEEKPMHGGRRLKVVNHGNDMYGGDESKPRLVSV